MTYEADYLELNGDGGEIVTVFADHDSAAVELAKLNIPENHELVAVSRVLVGENTLNIWRKDA